MSGRSALCRWPARWTRPPRPSSSPPAVVVDLSAVEFLASAGMGVLVAAHEDLTPAIRFAVVADGPATSRPLKLVGIADVVGLYATLDEALTALAT